MFEIFFSYKAEYVIEKESKKTDEKGKVRAGILSLLLVITIIDLASL